MKGTFGGARVAVLADDLIWATRLVEDLRTAGATPVPCRTLGRLAAALATGGADAAVDAAVVDLTARAYDGIEAIRIVAATGRPVLAIGQHDDHDLRSRALEAGAGRVFAYRKMATDGAAVLSLWLATTGAPDIVRHADPASEDGPMTDREPAGPARARPSIPPDRYGARLAAARASAEESGILALLIGVGADLRYLTGYVALPLERLTMLVVPRPGRPTLVVPRLKALPARGSATAAGGLVDVVPWNETDDAGRCRGGPRSRLRRPVARAGPGRRLRSPLGDVRPGAPASAAGSRPPISRRSCSAPLRIVKDDDEVALLRSAAQPPTG